MSFRDFLNEKLKTFQLSYRESYAPSDRQIEHVVKKIGGELVDWNYDDSGSVSVWITFKSSKSQNELQKILSYGTVSEL